MTHQRRKFAALLIVFLALAPGTGALASWSEEEELIRIEASVSPRRLSRGEEGRVILRLSVPEGIDILHHPDFIIEFKPLAEVIFPKPFFNASDLGIGVEEKDGEERLDLKEPVRISFTVSPEARRGSHILEGKITYYARSKQEGWLAKNTAKFYIAFATRAVSLKQKPPARS